MASESEGEADYEGLRAANNRKAKKSGGWNAIGLDPNLLKGIQRKGYRAPTPIQRKAIPVVLDGKDVVAMARTGSGKTAAFLLPILHKLKARCGASGARALLISPTRELALQTFGFVKALGKYTGIQAAVLVGGDSLEHQFDAVHHNPDILIATPGRLMHVVVEMNLRLSSVAYVVFDEADRLFEMGFAEQLKEVLARLPEARQTLLFSATLPKQLVEFARAGLSQPVLLRLDVDTKLSSGLETSFLACRAEDKLSALLFLLGTLVKTEEEQSLVFCATKHHVEYLSDVLNRSGFRAASLYSAMDHAARNIAVARFRAKELQVLVVTDIAARGVDIPFLDVAINFHFPAKAKLFVHRVGRVARAGRSGKAISLVSVDELPYLVDLFLFLGRPLTVVAEGSVPSPDALGAVPQAALDMEADATAALHLAMEVGDARKVADNAMKQYNRSRPPASTESVKRVKNDEALRSVVATPESHVHPAFRAHLETTEAARTQLLAGIRNYRSPLTVFETQTSSKSDQWKVMKAARQRYKGQILRKQDKNTAMRAEAETLKAQTGRPSKLPAAGADEVEEAFQTVIAPKYHQGKPDRKLSKAPTGANTTPVNGEARGQRSAHFIPFRQADFHQEAGYAVHGKEGAFEEAAAAATLDLTADEGAEMYKQQRLKRWDAKRKRYVGLAEEPGKKKIRTESGVLIPSSYKSDRYAKWRKAQKVQEEAGAGDPDAPDDGAPQHFRPQYKGRRSQRNLGKDALKKGPAPKDGAPSPKGGKGDKGGAGPKGGGAKGAAKGGRSELKSSGQILKQRMKKEAKQSYQKYRQGQNAARKSRITGAKKGGGKKGASKGFAGKRQGGKRAK